MANNSSMMYLAASLGSWKSLASNWRKTFIVASVVMFLKACWNLLVYTARISLVWIRLRVRHLTLERGIELNVLQSAALG